MHLIQFLQTHYTSELLIGYWLFSNVVSALPSPQSYTSFYRFFFNLMHGLAGSVGRISPIFRIPGPGTTDVPSVQPQQQDQNPTSSVKGGN